MGNNKKMKKLLILTILFAALSGCATQPAAPKEIYPKFLSYEKDGNLVSEIWERADGSRYITDGIKTMEVGGY
jgi:hypothetical protein